MHNMRRFVGVLRCAREVTDLCRDDDLVALHADLLETPRKHALRLAVAIHVGVVEVIHPGIETDLDPFSDVVLVDIGPTVGLPVDPIQAAHRPAAETDLGNTNLRRPDFPVVHPHVPIIGNSPPRKFQSLELSGRSPHHGQDPVQCTLHRAALLA